MPKNKIEIRVIGCNASGKTRIATILKKVLDNLDFEVDHELNEDYTSKLDRDRSVLPTLPEALYTLKDKTKITIKEFQTRFARPVRYYDENNQDIF